MDDSDIDTPIVEEVQEIENETYTDIVKYKEYCDFYQNYKAFFNISTASTKIYKDECMVSFDTNLSSTGIYICTEKFICFGERFVDLYR